MSGCMHFIRVYEPGDFPPNQQDQRWICPTCGGQGIGAAEVVAYEDIVRHFHGSLAPHSTTTEAT